MGVCVSILRMSGIAGKINFDIITQNPNPNSDLLEAPSKNFDLDLDQSELIYKLYQRAANGGKKVPISYSVIFVLISLSMIGISTSFVYLNLPVEKTLLSVAYLLLMWVAGMNQGCHNKAYKWADYFCAFAIFLLNTFFYLRYMPWGTITYALLLFFGFTLLEINFKKITLQMYEIYINIWHIGVIVLIYLGPVSLEQKNLF